MKKILATASLALGINLAAVATNEVVAAKNGDPKKPAQQQPTPKTDTFGLTNGYFSFFDFFLATPTQLDSTKTKSVAQPVLKEGAIRKF
jgi:hypothetical protein